jgi:hypothetical protein
MMKGLSEGSGVAFGLEGAYVGEGMKLSDPTAIRQELRGSKIPLDKGENILVN